MDNSGQYGQSYGQNVNNFSTNSGGNLPYSPQPQPYPQAGQLPQIPPRPAQPIRPGQPGTNNGQQPEKKDHSGLVKTIALVFTSLLTMVFLGLFVFMYINWNEAKTDVDGKVNLAVAEAENKLRTTLEDEFAEKEKYPYTTFAGPTDFGSLTFEFPKTWSVYVPEDASHAGDFHAYLNPGQVNVVEDQTVMALRVSIVNTLTDEIKEDFNDKVEDGEMTVSTTVVNGTNVDVYTGLLDSDLRGIVCVFKIRDKTALIQTDAMLFSDDFYRVLGTIRFNA